MDNKTKAEIIGRLSEIIRELAPNSQTREMYGGTMIEMVSGQPQSRCCGYFGYTNHVSLEFTNGVRLNDPDHILEGTGKQRRHIKLTQIRDVRDKRCKEFLVQVFKL